MRKQASFPLVTAKHAYEWIGRLMVASPVRSVAQGVLEYRGMNTNEPRGTNERATKYACVTSKERRVREWAV